MFAPGCILKDRIMRKTVIFLFALVCLFCGCSTDEFESASTESVSADYDVSREAAVSAGGAAALPVQDKKIIKTGRLGIEVVRLDEGKRRVDSLLAKHEGYYAKETFNDSRGAEYYLLIRIPANRYESFLTGIESGRGKILYKEIDSHDVTEQYLDIRTRLDNKRSYLERYRELLRRAGTIKEVLEVEEQIRALEEEIESAEGKLRYMDNQVSYSTLELTLKTEHKYIPVHNDSFLERLKESVSGGWNALVTGFLGLLSIWPFWIVIAVVVYLWRRWMKKQKKEEK